MGSRSRSSAWDDDATDPAELQQLYGTNLPPSLRDGAVRQSTGSSQARSTSSYPTKEGVDPGERRRALRRKPKSTAYSDSSDEENPYAPREIAAREAQYVHHPDRSRRDAGQHFVPSAAPSGYSGPDLSMTGTLHPYSQISTNGNGPPTLYIADYPHYPEYPGSASTWKLHGRVDSARKVTPYDQTPDEFKPARRRSPGSESGYRDGPNVELVSSSAESIAETEPPWQVQEVGTEARSSSGLYEGDPRREDNFLDSTSEWVEVAPHRAKIPLETAQRPKGKRIEWHPSVLGEGSVGLGQNGGSANSHQAPSSRSSSSKMPIPAYVEEASDDSSDGLATDARSADVRLSSMQTSDGEEASSPDLYYSPRQSTADLDSYSYPYSRSSVPEPARPPKHRHASDHSPKPTYSSIASPTSSWSRPRRMSVSPERTYQGNREDFMPLAGVPPVRIPASTEDFRGRSSPRKPINASPSRQSAADDYPPYPALRPPRHASEFPYYEPAHLENAHSPNFANQFRRPNFSNPPPPNSSRPNPYTANHPRHFYASFGHPAEVEMHRDTDPFAFRPLRHTPVSPIYGPVHRDNFDYPFFTSPHPTPSFQPAPHNASHPGNFNPSFGDPSTESTYRHPLPHASSPPPRRAPMSPVYEPPHLDHFGYPTFASPPPPPFPAQSLHGYRSPLAPDSTSKWPTPGPTYYNAPSDAAWTSPLHFSGSTARKSAYRNDYEDDLHPKTMPRLPRSPSPRHPSANFSPAPENYALVRSSPGITRLQMSRNPFSPNDHQAPIFEAPQVDPASYKTRRVRTSSYRYKTPIPVQHAASTIRTGDYKQRDPHSQGKSQEPQSRGRWAALSDGSGVYQKERSPFPKLQRIISRSDSLRSDASVSRTDGSGAEDKTISSPTILFDGAAQEAVMYFELPWELNAAQPGYATIQRPMKKGEVDLLNERIERLRPMMLPPIWPTSAAQPKEPTKTAWPVLDYETHQRLTGRRRQDLLPSRRASTASSQQGHFEGDVKSTKPKGPQDLPSPNIEQKFRRTKYEISHPLQTLTYSRPNPGQRRSSSDMHWQCKSIKPTVDAERGPSGDEVSHAESPLDRNARWFMRRPSDPTVYQQPLKDGVENLKPRRFKVLDIMAQDEDAASIHPHRFLSQIRSARKRNTALENLVTGSLLTGVMSAGYGTLLCEDGGVGVHSAYLNSVQHDNALYDHALYYKRHIQQSVLDFETFKNDVLGIPSLKTIRPRLEDYLRHIQNMYEATPQNSNGDRYMKDFCDLGKIDDHDILSACIPFMQLREHDHHTEGGSGLISLCRGLFGGSKAALVPSSTGTSTETAYPQRTLFQSLNPRALKRRDLKQVVCSMYPREKSYLCISQVWILIINEELIITCSTMSEKELYANLPASVDEADRGPPKRSKLSIHLETPDGNKWIFEDTDCPSYIDLVSYFSGFTTDFANDFAIYSNDHEVQPQLWVETLRQAKGPTLELILKDRYVHQEQHLSLLLEIFGHRYCFRTMIEADTKTFRTRLRQGHARSSSVVRPEQSLRKHLLDIQLGHLVDINPGPSMFHYWKDTISHPAEANVWAKASNFISFLLESVQPDEANHQESADQSTNKWRNGKLHRGPVIPREMAHRLDQVIADPGFVKQVDGTVVVTATDDESLIKLATGLLGIESSSLRMIVYDNLFLLPDRSQSATQEPEPSGRNQMVRSVFGSLEVNIKNFVDESALDVGCCGLTYDAYNTLLLDWRRRKTPMEHNVVPASLPRPFLRDQIEFCEALGCLQDTVTSVDNEQEETIDVPLMGGLYANLLSGLRGILRTLPPTMVSTSKVPAAILILVMEFHDTFDNWSGKLALLALRRVDQALARLFNLVNEMELYGVTPSDMLQGGGFSADERLEAEKHIVVTLLMAATILHNLKLRFDVLETGIGASCTTSDSSINVIYSHVNKASTRLRKAMHDIRWIESSAPTWNFQLDILFNSSVQHLRTRSWAHEFAQLLLWNEVHWQRVRFHADHAWRILRRGFRARLQVNRAHKDIRWKAAALPSDLAILLLPQILWKPLAEEQQVEDMYNTYVADLESTILTGDSSLAPLEKIRSLRHEFNAVVQLRERQKKVVAQLSDNLSTLKPNPVSSGPRGQQLGSDPHPRWKLLRAVHKGTAFKAGLVRYLFNGLDDLQREAEAQVKTVQDWRDNAGVVFTTITIIFLPLSFVSGVFGMNSQDIRNMATNQWAFWASALPFTLLVILVTLYFVDIPPVRKAWFRPTANEGPAASAPVSQSSRATHSGKLNHAAFLAEQARRTEAKNAADDDDADEDTLVNSTGEP